MVIRPLKEEELSQAREIWEECFDDKPAFVDWYFQNRFRPEEGLGVFISTPGGPTLLADLHLAPYRLRLRKKTYHSAYLVGLATRPQCRRRGLAKKLLTYALRHLAEKKIYFTFLMPFDLNFYTRLGWGVISHHRLCRPAFSGNNPKVDTGRIFQTKTPQIPEFIRLYSEWAAAFDGFPLREEKDWAGLLFDHYLDGGEVWLAVSEEGRPEAYALTLPNGEEPRIREIAYTNLPAGGRLLSYHLNRFPSSLVWTAPGKDPLIPPGCQSELTPVMLGRITNLEGMLKSLTFPDDRVEFLLEVEDPLIPENNGVFHFYAGGAGQVRVTRRRRSQPEVKCHINTLARLITGAIDPSAAVPHELQVGQDNLIPLLTKVFPPTVNYFNEYF